MKLAKASQEEIDRLMRWLQAREKSDDPPPPFMRVVFGYETLLNHCADPKADVLEFKPDLLAAMEDTSLLNRWEKSEWLIGKTNDGAWQAAGQKPATIGRGFVGKSVRDVLRQIRDLT